MNKYIAECPKCKMTYKGDTKYFRDDLKEMCFDGITKLVNYRLEGDTFDAEANRIAKQMIDNALAWLEAEKRKVLAE